MSLLRYYLCSYMITSEQLSPGITMTLMHSIYKNTHRADSPVQYIVLYLRGMSRGKAFEMACAVCEQALVSILCISKQSSFRFFVNITKRKPRYCRHPFLWILGVNFDTLSGYSKLAVKRLDSNVLCVDKVARNIIPMFPKHSVHVIKVTTVMETHMDGFRLIINEFGTVTPGDTHLY